MFYKWFSWLAYITKPTDPSDLFLDIMMEDLRRTFVTNGRMHPERN